jgi:hypothetical protein
VAADGRMLIPQEDEQLVLVRLRELRAAGYTVRGVAEVLNSQGFRTRRGGRWYHQYVIQQLARKADVNEAEASKIP